MVSGETGAEPTTDWRPGGPPEDGPIRRSWRCRRGRFRLRRVGPALIELPPGEVDSGVAHQAGEASHSGRVVVQEELVSTCGVAESDDELPVVRDAECFGESESSRQVAESLDSLSAVHRKASIPLAEALRPTTFVPSAESAVASEKIASSRQVAESGHARRPIQRKASRPLPMCPSRRRPGQSAEIAVAWLGRSAGQVAQDWWEIPPASASAPPALLSSAGSGGSCPPHRLPSRERA